MKDTVNAKSGLRVNDYSGTRSEGYCFAFLINHCILFPALVPRSPQQIKYRQSPPFFFGLQLALALTENIKKQF